MTEGIMAFRGLVYSKFRTESELAKRLNWPRQRLNKITTGQKTPTVAELDELAEVLGSSIGKLANYFLPCKSPNGQQNHISA